MTEHDENLVSDYVLGELMGAAVAAFETRLAREPELAAAVAAMEETVALTLLSDTPAAMPAADLRARVLAAAAGPRTATVAGPGAAPSEADKIIRISAWRWAGWSVAAACAVLAGLLWLQVGQRDETVTTLRQQLTATTSQFEAVSAELSGVFRERDALHARVAMLESRRSLDQLRIASLSSQLEQASYGFAVFDPAADEGVIEVVNLPELDATKQDYQLWVVDPQYPHPVDGGVFQVGADGHYRMRFHAKQPVAEVAAFAVSLERKGGVPVAEGPMVLVGAMKP